MRAAERHRRAAHRRHAHEVVRTRQECGEGRGERPPADRLQAHGGRDHLLLRDVHLEVAVGERLRELVRERRVRHLAVESDDVRPRRAECCKRVAVRLPRRDLLPDLVARKLEVGALRPVGRGHGGLRDVDADVAHAAELRDRRLGVLERLAVEAVLVLDRLDALSLQRPGDHDRRLPRGRHRRGERLVDRLDVVTVDRDRVPAEGFGAAHVSVEVPADHGLAALPEAVHVEDRREVVELEVRMRARAPPRSSPRPARCLRRAPRRACRGARGTSRRAPFRRRRGGPGRASRSRRPPTAGAASGALRAGSRACGTAASRPRRSRPRHGRSSRGEPRRGPSRRRGGRSPRSSDSRSRSAGSRQRGQP